MKKVLSIAGSDSSGGAGIQADIKTITAHKMYAMTAITAITAQNTTGVYGIADLPPEIVAGQIDCVFQDIRPDAVKTGMLSQPGVIRAVAERLAFWKAENIVVDPVMVSTSGCNLITPEARDIICSCLMPLATLLTPNIPETEVLSGCGEIRGRDDMVAAGRAIFRRWGCAVLVKGGHLADTADDVLLADADSEPVWFTGGRIDNPNTHGTGCTLSSAIACALAAGLPLAEAIGSGRNFVRGALSAGLNLGAGSGPLDHMWNLHIG